MFSKVDMRLLRAVTSCSYNGELDGGCTCNGLRATGKIDVHLDFAQAIL